MSHKRNPTIWYNTGFFYPLHVHIDWLKEEISMNRKKKIFQLLLVRAQFYMTDYILSCHPITNMISALSMITSTNNYTCIIKCTLYMCLIRERDKLETYFSLDFISCIIFCASWFRLFIKIPTLRTALSYFKTSEKYGTLYTHFLIMKYIP